MNTIITKSVIACPNCGYQKEEEMPTDACQFFYECEQCNTVFKPKQGIVVSAPMAVFLVLLFISQKVVVNLQ